MACVAGFLVFRRWRPSSNTTPTSSSTRARRRERATLSPLSAFCLPSLASLLSPAPPILQLRTVPFLDTTARYSIRASLSPPRPRAGSGSLLLPLHVHSTTRLRPYKLPATSYPRIPHRASCACLLSICIGYVYTPISACISYRLAKYLLCFLLSLSLSLLLSYVLPSIPVIAPCASSRWPSHSAFD